MSQLVVFVVPVRTVTESNAKGHWRPKHKRAKAQRAAARMFAASASMVRPKLPMHITVTRLAPRKLDRDNAISALKHVIDGVADWLGVDDGDERISWTYGQEKSKEYGVRVSVREVGE